MSNSSPQVEYKIVFKEDKPKKRNIFWLLGGCGLFSCLAISAIIFLLFYPSSEPSYPLTGNVSFPSAVNKGDDFNFVVTLTNPSAEAVFIKHIVIHDFLNAPSLLVGAKIGDTRPHMDSEPLGSRNDMLFAYFRDIEPNETLTVIFQMQAEFAGTYYANIGVYAKDPSRPEPAFITAYHYSTIKIEIRP